MLTAAVKNKALRAGFDLVGVARASDPFLKDAVELYEAWLALGHGQTMEYLARHAPLKADPSKLAPGGWKSVLCVGLLYGEEPPEDDATRARVSLYTRGEDYHEVMGAKLRTLAGLLERDHGFQARVFVDSEPVLERFWSWRAGLGWIGKNSMLLNRKLGSYFYLGGLLTTAELQPDEPQTDHCGKCRKCVDACPTGAITELRFVESGRCIGYHTIENRGVIPDGVKEGMDRWVGGCDVCQDVCPWNEPVTRGATFTNSNPAYGAELRDLARWSASDFKGRLDGVAMGRMKYSGFLRNVAVAVANSTLSEPEKREALAAMENSASALPEGEGKQGAREALRWAKHRGESAP